jgi:hypothetical protein
LIIVNALDGRLMTVPTLRVILTLPRSGVAERGSNGGEIVFGRGQKIELLAVALAGKIVVAAGPWA